MFTNAPELESLLKKTQQKIQYVLTLKTGNKPEDLIATNDWSGTAIEHARMNVVYKKNTEKFNDTFPAFKTKIPEEKSNPLLVYAIYGSQALFAKAGNCQEYVGLATYYLIQNNPQIKIEFLEMDDCFDHVFLKIQLNKEELYYDPWMGIFYNKTDRPNQLKVTAEKIIDGLKYELHSSVDKTEILSMLKECNLKLHKPLKLKSVGKLFVENFPQYIKVFEDTSKKELKSLYPSNPHLGK